MGTPNLDRSDWHPEAIPGRLVVLRRHRPEHLATVARWYRDPEIARLTRFHVAPISDDEIRTFFASRLLSPSAFAYAIHVAESDRLIGTTTFSALDPDNRSVLFHISIGERDAWGRGYGTQAAELMIGHAFDRLGLHRVALSVFGFNERAIRSYLKAGFVVEGRAREAVWRDGAFWDEVHMGILAREWRARRHAAAPGGSRVSEGG